MKKYTVLIDCDDVMVDLIGTWCWWLNSVHGTKVCPEHISTWTMTDYFPELTNEEVYEPLKLGSFWHYVKPKPGAVEYIKKMIDDGMDVYVCTASYLETIADKFTMVIQRHFPFINWSNIILTSNKQMVRGDVLIDDGVHNLEGGLYHKVLMSAPHNEQYNAEANGMVRANSWEEAYHAVSHLCNEEEQNNEGN